MVNSISVEDLKRQAKRVRQEAEDGRVDHMIAAGMFTALEAFESLLPKETIADLTPKERQEWVGRWIEYEVGGEVRVAPVIKVVDNTTEDKHGAWSWVKVASQDGTDAPAFREAKLRPEIAPAWDRDFRPLYDSGAEPEVADKDLSLAELIRMVRNSKEFDIDHGNYDRAGKWRDVERALGIIQEGDENG